jgi:exopolysaccharide biosynthesis polyprenyl glycosylphosphotransferase
MALIEHGADEAVDRVTTRPAERRRRATDRGDLTLLRAGDSYAIHDVPAVLRRESLFRRPLIAADAFAAWIAMLVALAISAHGRPVAAIVLAAPIVVLLAKLQGLYERDGLVLNKSTLDEIPAILYLGTLSSVVIWLLEGPLGANGTSRMELAVLLLCLITTLIGGRALARRLSRLAAPMERCLLVGDIDMRESLVMRLGERKAELVGCLPLVERRLPRPGQTSMEPYAALEMVVDRLDVHRIIIAPGDADPELVLNVVSRAKAAGVHVSIVPRLMEAVGSSVAVDELAGLVMLGVHRFGLSRSSRFVKRTTDLAGALLALFMVAPIMGIVALLIKLDTPGPVFFRQLRVGRNGQPFEMIKFRSMRHGADGERAELAALNQAGDGLFKVSADPRITKVGRILRRYSLDELPQLLNVLRGEMSLVGPRPLVLEEDKRVEGWHRRRLHLTPGMTGPWQVLGDTRVPLRDMVSIDYLYAANWSLWTDAKVLARTVGHVLAGRGL